MIAALKTALQQAWATDMWNPETRTLALLSRQPLQVALIVGPLYALAVLTLGLTP